MYGPHVLSTTTQSTDVDGNGRESVSIDPIVNFARTNTTSAGSHCGIDIIVRHELDGHVDPAFDDGIAVGVVSRKVRVDYTPR